NLSGSQSVPSIPIERVRPAVRRRRLLIALMCTALGAALAVLCAWRLAAFRLLPLDSPGTLHVILWPLFKRFQLAYLPLGDYGPALVLTCQIFLFLPFALILLSFVPLRPPLRRVLCSPALFWVSVAFCLLYWRFPLLLGGASNVDEGEFSVAAAKLLNDPV